METNAPPPRPPTEVTHAARKKPWPMSWILIAILLYATFQVGYYLFYGE